VVSTNVDKTVEMEMILEVATDMMTETVLRLQTGVDTETATEVEMEIDTAMKAIIETETAVESEMEIEVITGMKTKAVTEMIITVEAKVVTKMEMATTMVMPTMRPSRRSSRYPGPTIVPRIPTWIVLAKDLSILTSSTRQVENLSEKGLIVQGACLKQTVFVGYTPATTT
jgi:hypothetical protein